MTSTGIEPIGAVMDRDSLKYCRVNRQWIDQLVSLFDALKSQSDDQFFQPHPLTRETAEQIAAYKGQDLYYVQLLGEKVVGYGMLRGWDEGYDIPSLGIAIHPEKRASGLSKNFMIFLHAEAKKKGAAKVRLKVHSDNITAFGFYKRLGYDFMDKEGDSYIGYIGL